MQYPTIEQVKSAGMQQLLSWNRFLPSPDTEERLEIIKLVVERMNAEREAAAPGAWTAASKAVGWGWTQGPSASCR